jgi:hypothetical protein
VRRLEGLKPTELKKDIFGDFFAASIRLMQRHLQRPLQHLDSGRGLVSRGREGESIRRRRYLLA